jgi:hypothetical protein
MEWLSGIIARVKNVKPADIILTMFLVAMLSLVIFSIYNLIRYSLKRRSRFTAGGMNETVPEFERFVPEQSWNDVIKKMSLDPQVSKSHENFVNSQNMLPTSASLTVREDVEETPFVGLRRPNYQVPISNSARTQPSVYQTSLPANNRRGLF